MDHIGDFVSRNLSVERGRRLGNHFRGIAAQNMHSQQFLIPLFHHDLDKALASVACQGRAVGLEKVFAD